MDLRVFYLLEPPAHGLDDPHFGRTIAWDLPLLEGYEHEFVPNVSRTPGVGRFWGFRNPHLKSRVASFMPNAVLLVGYNYWSLLRFVWTWPFRRIPLMLRGDSHRLVETASIRSAIKRRLIATHFKRFSAFLYVGSANRRYFSHHGAEEARLFHAPHAVDNARFAQSAAAGADRARAWRLELGVPDDHALILFAGKLEPKKRPLDLLHAFLEAKPAGASLVFVGDGPLAAKLRAESAGRPGVFFASFANQSFMPIVYAACDVLVLPSYGPFETWGLAVNEAMAVGKPAIVSDHVGCAEDLVRSGETGLVFPAGDVAALREALILALKDRAALARWCSAARVRIEKFDYDAASKGLMRALEFVAKNP